MITILITLFIIWLLLPRRVRQGTFSLFGFIGQTVFPLAGWLFRKLIVLIKFVLRSIFWIFYYVIQGLYMLLENIKYRLL